MKDLGGKDTKLRISNEVLRVLLYETTTTKSQTTENKLLAIFSVAPLGLEPRFKV